MATLQVLGCSGGIGESCRTTSFLLGSHTLIDAGTGVQDLPLEALAKIDQIFLTHSHLDHVVSLPLMMDAINTIRHAPIKVYAQLETLDALRRHLFNDAIWPDFTQIFVKDFPVAQFHPLEIGQSVTIQDPDGEVQITSVPAAHTVAACGYAMSSGKGTLVFTGDTWSSDAFWSVVNQISDLKHLVIETSFPDSQRETADLSRHLTPARLAEELKKLKVSPIIHITHLKPGAERTLMQDIRASLAPQQVEEMRLGDQLQF